MCGIILMGTVLVLMRQQGVAALDSLWAEDGALFLQQAQGEHFIDAVLRPYAGYVHLVPRALAAIALHLPLADAAVVMSGGAALVASLVAAFVYFASSGVLCSRSIRIALSASVLLAPMAEFETIDNASNLHFLLLFGAFWALLWVPTRWAGVLASSTVLAASALSDPLTVLLVPVAIGRLLAVRTWKSQIQTLVAVCALTLQAVAVLSTSIRTVPPSSVADIGILYPLRVLIPALVGARWAEGVWLLLGPGLALVGALVLCGFLAYVARRPAFPTRVVVYACVIESLLFFTVSIYIRWGDWGEALRPISTSLQLALGPRYSVLPILLILAGVACVLDRPDPRWAVATWRKAEVTVLVLFSFVFGMNFSISNGRSGGPSWSGAMADALGQCATSPPGAAVTVPIAPPGWSVEVPCTLIRPRK